MYMHLCLRRRERERVSEVDKMVPNVFFFHHFSNSDFCAVIWSEIAWISQMRNNYSVFARMRCAVYSECELEFMNNENYSMDRWVVISFTVNYYRRNRLIQSHAELNKNKTKWDTNKILRKTLSYTKQYYIQRYVGTHTSIIAICQSWAHVTPQLIYPLLQVGMYTLPYTVYSVYKTHCAVLQIIIFARCLSSQNNEFCRAIYSNNLNYQFQFPQISIKYLYNKTKMITKPFVSDI